MRQLFIIIIVATMSLACNDRPVDRTLTEGTNVPLDRSCGQGEQVVLPSGTAVCIYPHAIVIETGFQCPAFIPHRFDFQSFSSCDSRMELPRIDLDFLNYRDLQQWPDTSWDVSELPVELPETNQLDLLWVIDNSGSMCQEQEQLRESFDRFIGGLAEKNVDFHLGITTTQMLDDYPLEVVAGPGHLQSQPQPVPGFDRSCQFAVDQNGEIIEGDYAPIRSQLEAAVACMATPDASLLNITDDEIRCALEGLPAGCSIPRAGCGGANGPCSPTDIFPAPSTYRQIPRVLRSADYQGPNGLDIDRLRQDFACASMVGTRGYGIEEGLAAAVAAVSPTMTVVGGPNEGFIRSGARFGLFFVTDENDCSHDGTLDAMQACGGDICEIYNQPGVPDSPLLEIQSLRNDLVSNLASVKGRPFDAREVLVASFHGPADRMDENVSPQQCEEEPDGLVMPVCATRNGISYSGDRYDRFMRSFPLGNTYPYASNATVPIEGLTCQGTLAPSLEEAGDFLANAVSP